MAEIDKIIKRIHNLMEKTVENGCTEEEAMSATAKAQQLLHDYQLSLSDIRLKEEKCTKDGWDTEHHKRRGIELVVPSIGRFTDTKCWKDVNEYETIEYKFFGLEHDVLIACYITQLCDRAMLVATNNYRKTLAEGAKADKCEDFQYGMAVRIRDRIDAMKDAQEVTDKGSGRDLVVVKGALVDAEWAKLNMRLTKGRSHSKRYRHMASVSAGNAADDKVAINPGVGGAAANTRLGG